MLTIGFTNHHYTLWNVISFDKWCPEYNCYERRITYNYLQNLSYDFTEAENKVRGMTEVYDIDLELRGDNANFYTQTRIKLFEQWQLTFGKLIGCDIRTCTDVWQLRRAMNSETKPRTRVYARKRLVELGELVRYTWMERIIDYADYGKDITFKKCSYATPKQVEIIEGKKQREACSGHFFNNGDKVTLEVELINSFCFDTQYGTTFINEFKDSDGRVFKYKGSNPPYFEDKSIKHTIKGTVEHGEYKGVLETRLKRIKVISEIAASK